MRNQGGTYADHLGYTLLLSSSLALDKYSNIIIVVPDKHNLAQGGRPYMLEEVPECDGKEVVSKPDCEPIPGGPTLSGSPPLSVLALFHHQLRKEMNREEDQCSGLPQAIADECKHFACARKHAHGP